MYVTMARTDIDDKKGYIISQLSSGVPQSHICKELKCKPDTLKSRLKIWGVANLKNQWPKNRTYPGRWVHASEYFDNTKTIASHNLKLRLFRDGYKSEQCEECKNTEWQGKKIPLELDHINGDRYDNAINNLRILCPNCHALTPTNSGKNRGKYSQNGPGRDRIDTVTNLNRASLPIGVQGHKKNGLKQYLCFSCGVSIKRRSKKCTRCAPKDQEKTSWPSDQILASLVWEESILSLSKKLGISDNAIRHRCQRRSISTPPRGYWRCTASGMTKQEALAHLSQ